MQFPPESPIERVPGQSEDRKEGRKQPTPPQQRRLPGHVEELSSPLVSSAEALEKKIPSVSF